MSSPPVQPPTLLDDTGRVTVDLPCAECGYNLRMRSANDVCPECRAGVQSALAVPAQRVQRFRFGLVLAIVSMACFVLQILPIAASLRIGAATGYVISGVMTIALATKGLAVWLLTAPPPPMLAPAQETDRARRVARLLIVFAAAGHLLAFWSAGLLGGMAAGAGRGSATRLAVNEWNASSFGFWFLIVGIGYIALGTHLGRLGPRLISDKLASLAQRLLWILGASKVLLAVAAVINSHPSWIGITQWQSGTTASLVFGSLAGGVAIGSILIAGAVGVIAFLSYREMDRIVIATIPPQAGHGEGEKETE